MSAVSPESPAAEVADVHGRRLLNATAVMASGTAVSRVLGLVRAMLIAFILGNGTRQAEGFNFANTVPTSLYLLLAGGTLNNVLVPQIIRAVKNDEDGGRAYVDRIITGFVMAMGALTVLLTLATPAVMSLYVSGWSAPEMADHWRAMVLMSYICMPQLFFYGVFFLIGQVLNARETFGPMMWAPAVNNIVSIAVFVLYLVLWGQTAGTGLPFTDAQAWLLAGGSTLGIIVQTAVLLPYLKRVGFTYQPRFDLKGTGLGATFHAAKWMIGFVALTSVAQIVVSRLASTATGAAQTAGGWLTYQNAYLIWVLPHSLLTVSLATAMLPSASRFAAGGNMSGVAAETRRALRLATTFLVPASIGLLVLADPITRLAYGHGTGASDYHFVTWALMGLAIGLVPFTIQYLYLRAFFAMDNTKTPFLLQIWISAANAAFAVALVLAWDNPPTVAARLGVAYSLCYVLGVFITHWALKRRLPQLDGRETWLHLGKLLLATVPAAALAWGISWWFDRFASLPLQIAGLVVAGGVAVLAFFFTAKRLGIAETASMLEVVRRRRPAADADAAVADAVTEAPLAGNGDGSLYPPPAEVAADAEGPASPTQDADEPSELLNTDPDGTGVFVPVAPPAPGPDTADVDDYPAPRETPVESGQLLAGRFRLDDRLAVRDGTQTWRAHDQVLARAVLVHLLPTADPRTASVLQAARQAAIATDSRFLRVLDVIEDGSQSAPDGTAYLVYEYAPGQTLAKVLAGGPLTGVEAAWLVAEIADALAPLHAQGHFHRHLGPANVLVTTTGNVKVMGFGVDASGRLPRGGVEEDVAAIGDLLYACLVAAWPHGAAFGLPAAPVGPDGQPLQPADVRSGVAPALNQIQQRIAGTNAVPGVRLLTAQAIAGELGTILGPASAASDLRSRLAGSAPVADTLPPMPTPASNRMYVSSPVPADEEPGDDFVGSVMSRSERFTPVPPPAPAKPSPRSRLPLLVSVLVIVLAVGVAGAAALTFRANNTVAAAGRLAVNAVDDFDPKADGGSGGESSNKAGLAIDGDLATAWPTEKYRKSNFGTKPGVGLVLDLGSVRDVSGVTLHLVGRGTDLEILVPKEAADSAPMKGIASWKLVEEAKNVADSAELGWPDPVRTRFLLVYLTALPAIGDGQYAGGIAEVTVSGH